MRFRVGRFRAFFRDNLTGHKFGGVPASLDLCEQEARVGKGRGVGPVVGEVLALLLDLAFGLAGSFGCDGHIVDEVLPEHALHGGVAEAAASHLLGYGVLRGRQNGAFLVNHS